MKTVLCLAPLLLFLSAALGQNELDGLRGAETHTYGTARFMGLGGAMGALGGDASVFSTNPAGFGIYRKSEVTMSMGYFSTRAQTNLNGNDLTTRQNNLGLNNLMLVLNDQKNTSSGVISSTWGLGYNRMANFYSVTNFNDPNPQSSLLDPWQDRLDAAAGPFADELAFDVTPAYEAFLLDAFEQNGTFFHANELHEGSMNKIIERTGSLAEWGGFYSANINNRFYLGGSVNIVRLNYSEKSTYNESDFDGAEFSPLREWEFNEDLNITGTAFKLKLGAIYRVNDNLRLGLAYHTPSYISVNDNYETDVQSVFEPENPGDATEEYASFSPGGPLNYMQKQPGRAQASAGIILGKRGIIGLEYEYVNYSNIKFRDDLARIDFSDLNTDIEEIFGATHNVRAGLELRFENYFARGGYRFNQSPYSSEIDISRNIHTYSVGAGYRKSSFFIDAAYSLMRVDEVEEFLFSPAYINPATVRMQSGVFVLTGGFRW